jgi:hypothetical protein
MQTQMNQTVQALRSEIEAVTTLQLALNRIALTVDENALSVWGGPRPEDVDDVAGDDGSFSREAVLELRNRAGDALSQRYTEVERVILGRAALESLARAVLHTGTGGVITNGGGAPPAQVLSALARSGAIRLDWAQEAVAQVREVLDAKAGPAKPAPKAKAPVKKPAKKPAGKVKAAVKKVVAKAKAKVAARKPAAKAMKAAVKAAVSKAVKTVKAKVAAKKKPASKGGKKK